MATALYFVLFALCVRGTVSQEDLAEEPLPSPPTVYEWGCEGYDPSTNSSLFAYLWCSSTDLAEESYMTGFIQGIKTGLLFPPHYSRYDLQDAWVLNEGVATYSAVCEMYECDEDLEEFFDEINEDYALGPASIPGKYNVQVSSIMPVAIAKTYAAYEALTSENDGPEYSVVLVVPYVYLVPMLAQRLRYEGALTDTNAYNFWIESREIFAPTALKAKLLIDSFGDILDWKKALEIMRLTMGYEADLFASATD